MSFKPNIAINIKFLIHALKAVKKQAYQYKAIKVNLYI
jgi:hypothetical protein